MFHRQWIGPARDLVVWVVAALVLLLISGLILRGACALFNRIAGGSEKAGRVPVPATGKAVVMVLGTNILQFPIDFLIVLKLGMGFGAAARASGGVLVLRVAIFWLVGVFVTSGVLSGMLPTGMGRATLVSLLYSALLFPILVLAGFLAAAAGWHPFAPGRG